MSDRDVGKNKLVAELGLTEEESLQLWKDVQHGRASGVTRIEVRKDKQMTTPITPQEYQELASRTECDQEKAAATYRNEADWLVRVDHSQKGLANEVGEFASALEKHIHYGQELDVPNIKEELGDIMWYVALACNALGFHLGDVMECNIHKLKKRYPDTFSDFRSLEENRDREAERRAMTKGMTKDDPEEPEPISDVYVVNCDIEPFSQYSVEEACRRAMCEDDGVLYEDLPRAEKDTVHYIPAMVGCYNSQSSRRLSKMHKWACDNCMNPLSDEVVRNLLGGMHSSATCPQCGHSTRTPKILG